MAWPVMRSAGLGTVVPAGSRLCPPANTWMASEGLAFPTSTSERPGVRLPRSRVWACGRRRSASMSSTLPSDDARVSDRFTDVSVLPSPGAVEVTTMIRGSAVGPGVVQRRPDDAVRLGERALRVAALDQQVRGSLTGLGDDAEERRAQVDAHVVRRLQGVVEILEEEGGADGEDEPEQRARQDVALAVGPNGRVRASPRDRRCGCSRPSAPARRPFPCGARSGC